MAQFVEVQSTRDKRFVIRAAAVESLEMPTGASLDDVLSDQAPAIIHLRDGSKIEAYNKSALQIMLAIVKPDAGCVFLDTPEVADGPG